MDKEWDVGELLNISSGYWKGCTLQTAVRLEIFSHIGNASMSSADIAKRAKGDKRATELLLNALAAIKLLHKNGNTYSNTSFSLQYLRKSSTQYMGHIVLHHHHILDSWAQLDQAVTTGAPVTRRSYGEEIERESFLMGMFNLAMELAPRVVEELDLRGRKKLLDLGGGPGTYAIHFCLAFPGLNGVIFDRKTTRPFAEQTISSFGLNEQITFENGDFICDSIIGGPYDAAWLSHILHSNGEDECYEIIRKTAAEMVPGGILLVHDFILDNSMDGPEFAALFGLNMLLNTSRGRCYSEEEIGMMMTKAGISSIKRLDFRSPNGSSIMSGIV